jgi:glyoxylase-like metal-dependent hydrolase (beta-lactamase superfamily II)
MVVHLINPDAYSDSNIYLLIGSRTALIDTGTGSNSGIIIKRIKELLGGRGLDMVILTHFHYDHVGGLADIVEEFGSEAFIGAGDAPYVMSADPSFTLSGLFGGRIEPAEVTELMEGDVIDLGEHRMRVINTPGHTCGGICLYDETDHSLFSGDTVFGDGVGRTDFPTGSAGELRNSLKKLSGIDVKLMYPGHMDIVSDGNRSIRNGLIIMGGMN